MVVQWGSLLWYKDSILLKWKNGNPAYPEGICVALIDQKLGFRFQGEMSCSAGYCRLGVEWCSGPAEGSVGGSGKHSLKAR